jgi:hypothetical protein
MRNSKFKIHGNDTIRHRCRWINKEAPETEKEDTFPAKNSATSSKLARALHHKLAVQPSHNRPKLH